MGFSVWWQYRAQWGPLKPFGGVVHGAHGKPLQIAGKTQHLDLQWGEARGRACFIVIVGLESPPYLIGMDIMRLLRVRIDVTNGTATPAQPDPQIIQDQIRLLKKDLEDAREQIANPTAALTANTAPTVAAATTKNTLRRTLIIVHRTDNRTGDLHAASSVEKRGTSPPAPPTPANTRWHLRPASRTILRIGPNQGRLPNNP